MYIYINPNQKFMKFKQNSSKSTNILLKIHYINQPWEARETFRPPFEANEVGNLTGGDGKGGIGFMDAELSNVRCPFFKRILLFWGFLIDHDHATRSNFFLTVSLC